MPRSDQTLIVLRGLFLIGLIVVIPAPGTLGAEDVPVADIGTDRELFVDSHRIESLEGVALRLHPPQRAEVALRFDDIWDGSFSGYVTVFEDDDRFRMYYRGWAELGGEQVTCYAESKDGIHWTKPDLGRFDFQGSTHNNIVLMGPSKEGTHNFTAFKDTRPDVPDHERYKALGGGPLYAYASADGIQWSRMVDEPVLTKGAFDSQNLAFWDPNRNQYVSYYRIFQDGVRGVAWATSDDFLTWSDPTPIGLGDTLPEHFYTNATIPYFRAPQYYLMFPKRFARERKRLPEHGETGISEAIFLSSRDGESFDRTFMEALIRPGPDRRNWGDRGTMPAWGILRTGPGEMSIYASQHYRYPSHHLRRFVFRVDGIASASAGYDGGELVTSPLRFTGSTLSLNYETAATGSVRIEILDEAGTPFPGFALDQAKELYGDAIDEAYEWEGGSNVSTLAGKPVRLRFVLKDADVYSYRFAD